MTSSYRDRRRGDGQAGFVQPPLAEAEPARSVGAALRDARERLGWELPSVAAHLRIRLPFLEAIEEGRTADLPGGAYSVGFIRSYARALGLDPAEMAERFRAEAGAVNRRTELDFPAPVPDRGVPALAVVLVGVVVAIGAYASWYRISGNDHPSADAVQRVPERLAALVPDRPPPAPPPAPVPVPAPATAPVAAAPNSGPGSAAAAIPASPPGSGVQLATLEPPATPGLSLADPPRIVLRASADAWMLVREKGGHELLNRVLKAGETWPVPQKANLLLSTGNAAGTEVVVNGVTMPPLGGEGVVRHDLPLDADALRGKVPDPAPQAVAKPFVSPHNQ